MNIKLKTITTTALLVIPVLLVIFNAIPLINGILLFPFAFTIILLAKTEDQTKEKLRLLSLLSIATLLGFFIAIFRPEGFNYPLILSLSDLNKEGNPFELYANLSKAFGAYLVILWFVDKYLKDRDPNSESLSAYLLSKSPTVVISILSVFVFAILFFDLDWNPKYTDKIILFAFTNLFISVLAEEAFFRLLLYNHICKLFNSNMTGTIVALAITSILFAASHTLPTSSLFFLYLFTGFVYAYVYKKTSSFIASVSTHWGVNLIHITLFEYPL